MDSVEQSQLVESMCLRLANKDYMPSIFFAFNQKARSHWPFDLLIVIEDAVIKSVINKSQISIDKIGV